ncbi:glycosyltransferase family 4 protein [Halpernia frigidisoli]|uniref:Glycosyltransferase involved in cell wall bisynthesis n=1 Tax=Halpernia frigidisoli TaxID=1125876 RepID=A0A1I3CUJ7_9FLAO|nr:glycosyltransferase family 1 protein [Halpernia frigidisoli]SFH78192.1 Glycosyltransferase involved in cell wall bisynthesis [Halpernia frigidisoli]
MKIAFDAKRFFHNNSGLGNYSRDHVRILAEHFPENQFVLLEQKKSERGKAILNFKNVFFHQIKSGKFARQLKFGKTSQEINSDIFHGLSGELPLKWNKKPIKKIVTIHDLIFVRYPQFYSFFDRKIHFWKFKNACDQADLIIAISEQTKRDIIEFLKIPAEKIKVVYQGCHQTFKEKKSEEFLTETRLKFNLPEKFILNVGTIEPRKNLLNIVKTILGTKVNLVVIGKKTKYFNKIEQFILKNNLKNQVYFLENVSMEELSAIYQLADIFVYPSLFEGFGIPVIEALFSKTPVITSNSSSLPEAGGKNSLYVNPESVEDLRSKISFLWNNESERQRLSENGFEYVQKFTDEKIAANLMKVYLEVLEN